MRKSSFINFAKYTAFLQARLFYKQYQAEIKSEIKSIIHVTSKNISISSFAGHILQELIGKSYNWR